MLTNPTSQSPGIWKYLESWNTKIFNIFRLRGLEKWNWRQTTGESITLIRMPWQMVTQPLFEVSVMGRFYLAVSTTLLVHAPGCKASHGTSQPHTGASHWGWFQEMSCHVTPLLSAPLWLCWQWLRWSSALTSSALQPGQSLCCSHLRMGCSFCLGCSPLLRPQSSPLTSRSLLKCHHIRGVHNTDQPR